MSEGQASTVELALAAAKSYTKGFEGALGGPAISYGEFKTKTGCILIDCRSDKERLVSMVKGAISASEFENKQMSAESAPDKSIAVYCTIGYRSGQYASRLAKGGWKGRVYNCNGIVPWSHEGVPLVDSEGEPTKNLHVYGSAWNIASPDYKSIMFGLWSQISTFLLG